MIAISHDFPQYFKYFKGQLEENMRGYLGKKENAPGPTEQRGLPGRSHWECSWPSCVQEDTHGLPLPSQGPQPMTSPERFAGETLSSLDLPQPPFLSVKGRRPFGLNNPDPLKSGSCDSAPEVSGTRVPCLRVKLAPNSWSIHSSF